MDSTIKKGLIDEINQLTIKNEPCSSSGWFASSNCSVSIVKMEFNASEANLQIDYNVRVSVNENGVRVYNDFFEHIYRHGPMPHFYSNHMIYSQAEVIVKNVGRPAMNVLDVPVQPEMYNLILKFKEFGQAHRFVSELERHDYNEAA